MRTAQAYSERGSSRSAHKLAEKLAKNAGVDFEDWIAEALAEYAEDLGVAPEELSERERLEAIEDRIDRVARASAAPRRPEPREPAFAPRSRRESPRAGAESPRARYLDDEPRARPSRERDDYAPPRGADRLERAIEDIEKRAERNETRTARALESLTGLVANRSFDGSRLEQAVADIERRAQRNEERTAAAIESLQEMVAGRGDDRERLVQAVAEVEARAQRNADRTAKALESLSQMVASRDEERERLETAIARANKRSEESETRAARAFESLSAMVAKPARAPAQARAEAAAPADPVADRLDQLARRAAAPAPAAGSDEEALRLVSERLARRRQKAAVAEPVRAAPELSGALGDLRRDLRLLSDKVDQLSGAAVGPGALEAFRAQTRDVERALTQAGEKVAGAERMQQQVAALVERVEKLAAAQPASAELAQALKALADAHAKADRENPAKALKAVEKQLDDLGARIEAAARRPAQDAGAFADLTRRIDSLRAAVERQPRPEASEYAAALAALNAKLDVAAASGTQSAAGLSALTQIVERLEDELRRPASVSLDPRPLEELARRIEGVQGALSPKVDGLQARIDDLSRKLEQPANAPQMEAVEAALRRMAAKVEQSAHSQLAPKVEDLQGAIDALVRKLDRTPASPAGIARIDEALGDILARLDHPSFQPQIESIEAALRRLAAKLENGAAKPDFDSRPLEDLARRIEGAHGQLAPKVDDIHAALGELSRKIDHPARTAAEIARLEEAMRLLSQQVETALSRSASVDPRPLEALERRLESVRGAVEDSALSPQVARLEAGLADIRARLDSPAFAPQMEAVDATLRRLASKFEEAAARPTTVSLDSRPIEDLARRIESVRASLESSPSMQPHVERLETALGVVSDKLDRAGPIDTQGLNSTLAEMNRRLEEAFRRTPEFGAGQIDALAAQVEAVRETVERQAQQFQGAETAVRALAAKLERASGFDQARLEVLLGDLLERMDHEGGALAPLAEAVASMNDKLDRMNPGDVSALAAALARGLDRIDRVEDLADRDARLEGLVRDVADRLEGVEGRLAGAPAAAGESWSHIEFAVRDLTEKVADLRATSDTRAVEQDVRALHDKLDDLAERRFTATAPGPNAGAAPEGLIDHLQEIQFRIDKLAAQRASPAGLDEALVELSEQMDALRATREATAREASTVADLRADHATLDRRLDARFSGLQDVLEKLVDRIARLERDPAPEARAPAAAQAPAAPVTSPQARAALPDIPDREITFRAPPPETPIVAPSSRPLEQAPSKTAAVNAHIAAARRLANAAASEVDARPDKASERRSAGALGRRAQTLLVANSRPVMLGAAIALPVLAGLGYYEFHGHNAVRKSEIDAATTVGEAAPVIDDAPTGAIGGAPKVIAAPLPAPGAPAADTPKPSQALVAALPSGVNSALAAAAANGDLGAVVEIAQRYLEGRTVPRDPKVAADWLQVAADAGSPFANYRLGALYEKGVGVAKDAAKARAFYTKAAEAGNSRAMHNLAVLYAQDGGQGKPDYTAAIDWFKKAGAYGIRDSQFNLGVLYGRGLGSGQDLAQSWLWFSLAARQGDTDAAHKRDEVALRMDGRAMTAAKKMLDDFKILTPDPAVNDPPALPPAAADAAPDKKDAKKPV